jgi:hypothetical protein
MSDEHGGLIIISGRGVAAQIPSGRILHASLLLS